MQRVDVSEKVWDKVLAARKSHETLSSGDWTPAERPALDLYGPLIRTGDQPFIFAQIGQSLDGRIATTSGDAQDISGKNGLEHLHRLRALADAVVIGVKTALHDDPQLTVRLAQGENPTRVVIDPSGRLPDDAKLLQDASAKRVIIQAVDRPRPDGIEVIKLRREEWISPHDIVAALRGLGLHRLLIEGGATTIAQFLEAGLLSRLHVAVAPLLIGAGPSSLTLQPVAKLAQARRFKSQAYDLGSDVLFDCSFDAIPAQFVDPEETKPVSSGFASLIPSIDERLARVRCDLKAGLPFLLSDTDRTVAVIAVEQISKARLEALSNLIGAPELILTANRGRAVLASDRDGAPVCITPPAQADLDWYLRLADPSQDGCQMRHGPLHLSNTAGTTLPSLALTLVKSAELLPAVVLFELPAGRSLPEDLGATHLNAKEAQTQLEHAADLSVIASAALPLQAHDAGRLHVFRDPNGTSEHIALEIGTPDPSQPVLCRLHSACFTGDVLGSLKCDCGPQLQTALTQMGDAGAGILLYLNQEGRGIGLGNKMRVYDLQAQGFDTVDANHHLGFKDDERDFRVASVMMRTLGFRSLRLLTNNPAKVKILREHGLTITEQLPLRVGKNVHNGGYLAVKAQKFGHAL